MSTKIKKCPACKRYTFKDVCPDCGSKTSNPNPPKFSPEDKYGKYRRQLESGSENKGTN